jgi:peptidoglycan/xylan/chitin deacetylase (PgdA/CDA1 family)
VTLALLCLLAALMAGCGSRTWEVDSHSLTHADLTTLSASKLRRQVLDSRAFLQRTLHTPADSFCYPSNRYDSTVVAAVKAAGVVNLR